MESELQNSQSSISKVAKIIFYGCSIATALYGGATSAVGGLQSTMNSKSGLGMYSLAARYTISTLTGFLITPFLIRKIGPAKLLVIGDLLTCTFVLANFYPEWFVMIPVSAISGMGGNFVRSATTVVIQTVASHSSKTKDVVAETQRLFGIYTGICSLGQMLGNGAVEIIFRTSEEEAGILYSKTANQTSLTSHKMEVEYAYLKESAKLEVFTPNPVAKHILLSFMAFIHCLAAFMHWRFVPLELEKTLSEGVSITGHSDDNIQPRKSEATVGELTKNLKGMLKYLTSTQGLLLANLYLYHGFVISFAPYEFNRAYVACVLGVKKVGGTFTVLAFSMFLSSYAVALLAKNAGIASIMVFGLFYDIANYLGLLLWRPTKYTLFVPYILSAVHGITDGVRHTGTNLVAAEYSTDKVVGLSACQALYAFSSILACVLSTPLCVYTKLYSLMTLCILSTLGWAIEHKRRGTKANGNKLLGGSE